eukprot:XP_001698526.1 predicted protein [Chlamydomonas reinhardtii]
MLSSAYTLCVQVWGALRLNSWAGLLLSTAVNSWGPKCGATTCMERWRCIQAGV